MLLTLGLPAALEPGGEARVTIVHARAGERLAAGAKLLDFSIDLSAGAAHDCPPITHYRLIVREAAWLRRLSVTTGDAIMPGAVLGWLGSDANEPLDAVPARAARVTVASLIVPAGGWGG